MSRLWLVVHVDDANCKLSDDKKSGIVRSTDNYLLTSSTFVIKSPGDENFCRTNRASLNTLLLELSFAYAFYLTEVVHVAGVASLNRPPALSSSENFSAPAS